MWKKLSISKKAAILVIWVMSLFFLLVTLVQIFFFGKAYDNNYKNALMKSVKNVSQTYTTLTSPDEIQQCINEASNESSSNIMILNSEGNIIYSLSYRMTVTSDTGEAVNIILDEIIRGQNQGILSLKNNELAEVEYIYFDDKRSEGYFPIKIKTKYGEAFSNSPEAFPNAETRVKKISGKISQLSLPLKNNHSNRFNFMYFLMLWTEKYQNSAEFSENGEFFAVINEPEHPSKCMLYAVKNENSDIVLGLLNHAPAHEAMNASKRITFPWLMLSITLSLIIALVFSSQITKPIRSVSRVASKMGRLDFSEKCHVSSEDEIGSLARNINNMSETLDKTITELTKANEKLKADIEKDKMLERQRKEFVDAVSHELKTPLAVIRAYTEGLADTTSEERRKKYVDIIITETEKMDLLIVSMLENSRLESGAEVLNLMKYDLKELTKNACAFFEQRCAQRGISLEFSLCDEPLVCSLDPDKIEQVINNFMTNALKNTPENGKIRVSAVNNVNKYTISVENQGNHIPEDETELIWDRFYKSDKSRKRTSDGSVGLGLSIAKNILKLHKADYRAENTDMGVKFSFSLPTD